MRTLGRKVLGSMGVVALVAVLVACGPTPDQNTFVTSINSTRKARLVPGLTWDDKYLAKAQAWSQQMADSGDLKHSDLKAWYPGGYRSLGENVGVGPSLSELTADFIASPTHLANMVNPRFTRLAVGVVKKGDVYWVTEVFIG